MAEKLSQAEIDALLSAAFSGQSQIAKPKEEAPKYRKYDFKSPRKFTKDRLKMLNGIFDSYSRSLNTRINGLLHSTCEVEVNSVEEQRYYEFSNGLTDGAVVSLASLVMGEKREDVPIVIFATPTIMVSMMDRLMGGTGAVEDDLPSDYSYTDLDLTLYESLMRDFVALMGGSWSNYIDLDFEFGRVEPNPTLVQLINLEETVVLVGMNIKFPNCDGQLSICLPGMMLTNIFTAISRENPGLRAAQEDCSDEIYDHLRESTLEIVVELGRTTVELRDIYHLNVGDIINLNQSKDSLVGLRIGGTRWFSGPMGTYAKHLAVKIKDVHEITAVERRSEQADEQ